MCADMIYQGCDASLLLDGPSSEKTAPQNSGIFGFDFIDDVKSLLEAQCPGVVSCADIIIAATRDAVALVFQFHPSISVVAVRRLSVPFGHGD